MVMRSTQELGVFTVTTDESKAGVAINVKGSYLEHDLQTQSTDLQKSWIKLREQKRNLSFVLEEQGKQHNIFLAAGIRLTPMFSTQGSGHIGYFHFG